MTEQDRSEQRSDADAERGDDGGGTEQSGEETTRKPPADDLEKDPAYSPEGPIKGAKGG